VLAYGKRDLIMSTPLSGAIWDLLDTLTQWVNFDIRLRTRSELGVERGSNETGCLEIAILYDVGCATGSALQSLYGMSLATEVTYCLVKCFPQMLSFMRGLRSESLDVNAAIKGMMS
jgi:hypothetical protein